jgi:Na+/proline symporter
VLVTDCIQFGIAMTGSVLAAVYALKQPAVGGLSGIVAKIDPSMMGMLPDWSHWSEAVAIFIVPLTVQWWATWYPGSEPGGGSYIAQRMLAAKSERDALSGTLFFNVAHYALRPWPWILVALASMLVFPHVSDIQRALPQVDPALLGDDMAYSAMLTFLPSGLLGIMVAGLLAAYVSTISTHLNWGTSYLVHDFYRRFLKPGADERHYVQVGRFVTVVLMIGAALITTVLGSARRSFDLMLSVGAGTGLIYLLRWFWWRINAWSEIAAMISSFVIATSLFVAGRYGVSLPTDVALIVSVTITTAVWVIVAVVTKPTDPAVLERFYRTVRPAGPGWAVVRRACGGLPPLQDMSRAFLGSAAGCVFVYSALFGAGQALIGSRTMALVFGGLFVASAIVMVRILQSVFQDSTEDSSGAVPITVTTRSIANDPPS